MKVNKEFIVRTIMDETVLIPIGNSDDKFNGLITTNEIGQFIWEHIPEAENEKDLLRMILDEYETDAISAESDLAEFLEKLRSKGIIE